MPVTTLDPNTGLIVIDLQRGIVGMPLAHPVAGVLQNAAALAGAFRARHLPVVLVNVVGGAPGRTEQQMSGERPANWADFVPELNRQPADHLVSKRTWGAFTGTDLDTYLRGRGCTQLVVLGVATSFGVESTARQAHELGYNVTLALDAMTDRSVEAHENSIARVFPRLGETGTTGEIVAMLDARGA